MTTINTIIPSAKIGHWHVLAVDATGRRAGCRCRCGTVREVSVAALLSGESTSCGCGPLSLSQVEQLRVSKVERQRRRDRDWRPGERS